MVSKLIFLWKFMEHLFVPYCKPSTILKACLDLLYDTGGEETTVAVGYWH